MVLQNSTFTLDGLTNNLTLTGTNNYIDVGSGSALVFQQNIGPGNAGTGGIALGGAHTGPLAVQVEVNGKLLRTDPSYSYATAPDQVTIGGSVTNMGGTVEVDAGTSLQISGTNGFASYWQFGEFATLKLASHANITAAGMYYIDGGTVLLTAPSGGSADELDGAGVEFGNDDFTFLTIVDSTTGTPGTVTIQGGVSLAASTTTTLNFNGTNNTADLLDVESGGLNLAGALYLKSGGSAKPTQPLNFLDDQAQPGIWGAFASLTTDIANVTCTGTVVPGATADYYQVTFTNNGGGGGGGLGGTGP
jgi:hypothetical protein